MATSLYKEVKKWHDLEFTLEEIKDEVDEKDSLIEVTYNAVVRESRDLRYLKYSKKIVDAKGRFAMNRLRISGSRKWDWYYSRTDAEIEWINSWLRNIKYDFRERLQMRMPDFVNEDATHPINYFKNYFFNKYIEKIPTNRGYFVEYSRPQLKRTVLDVQDNRCIFCRHEFNPLSSDELRQNYNLNGSRDHYVFFKINNRGPVRLQDGALENYIAMCGMCRWNMWYVKKQRVHEFSRDIISKKEYYDRAMKVLNLEKFFE